MWGEPDPPEDDKMKRDYPDHDPDGQPVTYAPAEGQDDRHTKSAFRRRAPLTGWLGWIETDIDPMTDAEVVVRYAWEPPQLYRALRDLGYSEMLGAILRTWREKQLIETDNGGDRFTVQEKCGRNGGRHRVILLKTDDFLWEEKSHDGVEPVEKLQ